MDWKQFTFVYDPFARIDNLPLVGNAVIMAGRGLQSIAVAPVSILDMPHSLEVWVVQDFFMYNVVLHRVSNVHMPVR